MDKIVHIVVTERAQKKRFDIALQVPTAFGTKTKTLIATNHDGASTDNLVAGIIASLAAVGIVAQELSIVD